MLGGGGSCGSGCGVIAGSSSGSGGGGAIAGGRSGSGGGGRFVIRGGGSGGCCGGSLFSLLYVFLGKLFLVRGYLFVLGAEHLHRGRGILLLLGGLLLGSLLLGDLLLDRLLLGNLLLWGLLLLGGLLLGSHLLGGCLDRLGVGLLGGCGLLLLSLGEQVGGRGHRRGSDEGGLAHEGQDSQGFTCV
jgi:hypothetical protein